MDEKTIKQIIEQTFKEYFGDEKPIRDEDYNRELNLEESRSKLFYRNRAKRAKFRDCVNECYHRVGLETTREEGNKLLSSIEDFLKKNK